MVIVVSIVCIVIYKYHMVFKYHMVIIVVLVKDSHSPMHIHRISDTILRGYA